MPNPPTIDYGNSEPRKQITLIRLLIVIGLCSLLITILLPSHNRYRDIHPESRCGSHLRTIGQAIALYAAGNAGHYPPDFQTLLATQQLTSDTFICPLSADTKAVAPSQLSQPDHCSYIYVGATLTTTSDPSCIAAVEDPTDDGMEGGNVLFADGHVEFVGMSVIVQLLNDLATGKNPPSKAAFTHSSAQQDYNQHWKSRTPQLKTGLWLIPTTQPATLPSAR
jgi:prepilin-type processing-associated H-X9-DG protein